MNTRPTPRALEARVLNRLRDRAQAGALRAPAIDEFFRVSYTVLRATLSAALSGLNSLAQRSGRRGRGATPGAAPCMDCGAA